MASIRLRLAAPLAMLLAVAAGGRAMAGDSGMAGMNRMEQMPAAGSADAQMQSGMQQMQKTMQDAPMTGDPDQDFVAMMLPHHEGAVAMAKVELAHGKDPSLLKLARGIVAAQDREIAFMKAWQASHPAKGGTTP